MRTLATVLLAASLGGIAHGTTAADPHALARAAAEKLAVARAVHPQARSTDFQGTNLYCVTLSAGDLRRLGYRGHAFFCENSTTGEVLGAVLGSRGGVRCLISGSRTDAACYSFDICGYADGVCLQ